MSGLNVAYAKFGAVPRNKRWSWSARSGDGNTVVLALWKHLFDYSATPISYSEYGNPNLSEWRGGPGNIERIENLMHARAACEGLFRVVISVARDVNAAQLEIASAFDHPRLLMKLTDLDETSGEFRAINTGR
jgi:hypothetical protein